VTKGLNGGAVVVTDGQEKLQDGNKVDVHTPNAPNGSAPRPTRSKGSPAK
jgi:hypothetical protein